jgi:hypothetical protein
MTLGNYIFYLSAKERKPITRVCIQFSELFYLVAELEEGTELAGMRAAAAGLVNSE